MKNLPLMKNNVFMKIMNSSLISLPTPINISIWWNFGSLLGICLMMQIISGFILTMHYCPNINYAFFSVIHIMNDVNFGWLIRYIHLNGASMFFLFMYTHILRGIYYSSYFYLTTWISGTLILLVSMATAFMGYVLPWGQMSFWGATVITNLVSTIPYLGDSIVIWLWGGFSVSNPTLNRFYSIHFILPLVIAMLVMIHLTFLHQTGSNNPLGLNSNFYKIPFNPYFTLKDVVGFIIMFMILLSIITNSPNILNDPENFIEANSMITPIHIQPEWYFLFAYSILRSIPNKLGGVIGLIMSILIILIMPFYNINYKSNSNFPLNQLLFWFIFNILIILTWIGAQPIEFPFYSIGQITSVMYFSYFIMFPMISWLWYKIMN
uniref:Cytochrome b n=2 Tax=unclassified Megaspilidae TaxID=1253067 RepID=A0A3S8V0X2_9HYME|nr:cytochrome b [Megaspilidae sp. SJW-2015]AZL93345.1 cytochrome b [Megaspilidae sp. ZJUH_2016022]